MTRVLLSIPLTLLLTAALGYALCQAFGANPHVREMVMAGIISLIATIAAVVPLFVFRRANQATAAQVGLVATTIHLFAAIALAGIVILILHEGGQAFTYWLFAFYWTTLIIVATESVRLVRSATPIAKAAPKQ